jgi:homoserine kinase
VNRRRTVRVPASSANLGPGFDVMGAALDLHMEVDVVETGQFAVHTDLRIARDRRNLIVRGFAALADPDAFEFTIRSDIPLSGGLGTSAAAIVAGLVAADSIFELEADLLTEATRIEGHPDNVAAALYGGFVLCSDGHAERFEPPPGLECLLVVPSTAVRTQKAREALPSRIPVSDAVFNIAHASLLVLGLAKGDLALVRRGLRDRIHQPRRAHLYPRSWELVQQAQDLGALGATISGAGPTVLVWCDFESTGAVAARLHALADGWAEIYRVPFTATGAQTRF